MIQVKKKKIIAVTLTIGLILVIVTAVIWTYLVVSYESDLGTSNVVQIDLTESTSDESTQNHIVDLSFGSGAEDISWSSIDINLDVDGTTYGCSFGSQSVDGEDSDMVTANLGADGKTFTTQVDATDSESYTYLDVSEQLESNSSAYWMKFSSTDIYLGSGVSWKYIEDADMSDVTSIPDDMSSDIDDRLEWYEYDMSVHRVNPNDGVYVIQKDNMSFKIKFLTYYNSDDESRYPTMLIASIGESEFPALDNPDLVIPSPCKISTEDLDSDYWNSNETISLFENGVNFCDGKCTISLEIQYETISVEIDKSEFEIGQ